MIEGHGSHRDNAEIRVRIAPSPTGPIHVGTMHTALFNWLFARGNGGKFIVRLEDTDQERSRKEWEDVIYSEMKWLGFDWDEGPDIGGPYGPYRQMERLDLYRKYAQQLLETGHAYYCYCTPEELEAERTEAQKRGVAYKYSRRCRELTPEQRREFEVQGRKPAIRFRVPDGEIVAFDDVIRGRIENPTDSLGDFIIVRPNGLPLYNFAVVIDDVTMKITHVIRGEDHISNTPVQVLLYQALGLPMPRFGHAGNIKGTDGKKLSKRNGDAFVGDYRDRGYLPEALFNFLALLGWTPDDGREFLTREELIKEFRIDRVTKAPAVFDPEKLDWMNGHYIRNLSLEELTRRAIPYWQKAGMVGQTVTDAEFERLKAIMAPIQERIKVLSEVPQQTDIFFAEEVAIDPDAAAKMLASESLPVLAKVKDRLAALGSFTKAEIESACRALQEELGMKPKAVFQPIRVAVTGRTVSPPLFETMAILGKERTLKRLGKVIGR